MLLDRMAPIGVSFYLFSSWLLQWLTWNWLRSNGSHQGKFLSFQFMASAVVDTELATFARISGRGRSIIDDFLLPYGLKGLLRILHLILHLFDRIYQMLVMFR
jgi:hypothetical protein